MEQKKTFYPMLSGDTSKLFSWKTAVLSAAGLTINILLANFVKWLELPLYIDNVGSVLVGALAGPIPGMMVGFLSNALNAFGDPITMYYGILTVIMALLGSVYTKRGLFKNVKGCIGIIISFIFVGGAIGSVMTWLLYGGGIGGIGAPLALTINSFGVSEFLSQILADVIIDIPDKTITVLLVVVLIKVCVKLCPGYFPLSAYYDSNGKQDEMEYTDITKDYHGHSVKMLVLKMIIVSAALISVVTTIISFSMYCKVSTSLDERLVYLIQLISVSFAITLIICVITIWVATKRIAEPVSNIVAQSREFLTMPSQNWLDSEQWRNRIAVHTGDEIEELYHTICDEQETVARNAIQMKENEAKLRHSKELEDALETARQASQAKGQFLSRMSHEIRTPLNAVIGYMTIAKTAQDEPEKIMHCIQNSEMAAKHLLSIINDVLDISSIESGKMKIAHEEFDLKAQLTTISTLFFNQAKDKNVQFEAIVHELTTEWVIGDSLRMNQILMNLLSNAVKFTPENGKVTLTISQLKQTDTRIFLKCIVSDTGIGMSEEFKQRLFTPFEQESATTAQKYGGTGLGLSITGNLVSMMGGAIDVQSEQGKGSTFIVTIPLEISLADHNKVRTENYAKLRALIVDDNEESCEYVKKLLKGCSVKSDAVLSGEDAIKQLRKRKDSDYAYDFCIMDWNMPGMNGIETARAIRKEFQDKLPIMIATAYDITDIEDEAKSAGVDKLISKPLFQSTLFDFIVTTYGKYEPVSKQERKDMNLAGLHVLLAEDNAMNREIAVDILQKAKIIVEQVENGRQAVEVFRKNPDLYDVILMDIQMPVMDGYEATRAIRSISIPQAKRIPIVAMTANAFHEDVSAAISAGMNAHIAKPIDYDKLFEVLQKQKG